MAKTPLKAAQAPLATARPSHWVRMVIVVVVLVALEVGLFDGLLWLGVLEREMAERCGGEGIIPYLVQVRRALEL